MKPLSDSEFEAEYGFSPKEALAKVKSITEESHTKWRNIYTGIMLKRAIEQAKLDFEESKSSMTAKERMEWRMRNLNK